MKIQNRFVLMLISVSFFWVSLSSAQTPVELTAQDVEELQHKILSDQLPYAVRHEVAQSAVFLLQQQDRQIESKRLFLRFANQLRHDERLESSTIPPELVKATHSIDQGNYVEARKGIDAYIQSNPNPHDSLSIVALKADHEPAAMYGLFADAKDEVLSVYSSYVMGIMLVRNQALKQAAIHFQTVSSPNLSPRIDRWLKIDEAKFGLIIEDYSFAHSKLDNLLSENEKDAQAIFWKARAYKAQQKDEQSREVLARLIPVLYPDTYLVTETVSLTVALNELDIAALILTDFEKKLTPSRDFYELFAIVRGLQKQAEASNALKQKAESMEIDRNAVSDSWIKTTRLSAVLKQIQSERRAQTLDVATGDPLDKAYLLLLNEDATEAIRVLEELIKTYPPFHEAQFMLSSLHRRQGNIQKAFQTLQTLHQNSPKFRRYVILQSLADYAVQLNDQANAKSYYELIQKEYPASYQAETAKLFLQNGSSQQRKTQAVAVSSVMTKYENYSAPFIIKEILTHFDSHNTFSRLSSLTGTSPRKGLGFVELFYAILKVTQYSVKPFSGTVPVVSNYLSQEIPVVYCKGGMFASQHLELAGVITGYDVTRKLVYLETVLPGTSHVLTEQELLEGICIAVHPIDVAVNRTDEMKQAFGVGNEFINLNLACNELRIKEDQNDDLHFDLDKFNERIGSIAQEPGKGFIPLKLAVLRYQIQRDTQKAASYAKSLEEGCSEVAQYWFDLSAIDFEMKQFQKALEHIGKAVELSPGNIQYQIGKARAFEKLNQTKDAVALCEKLRDEHPHNPAVSMHLLAFYEKSGLMEQKAVEEARLKKLLNVRDVKIQLDE